MWKCLERVLCLKCACLFAIFLARTGASPAIVNGVLGHSVSLFPSIPVRQDVDEVVWKRSSPSTKIARYLEGSIKYFNTNYNKRITLHSGNFSLEIHDLRKEDADEYEVIVTAGDSGDERRERIQLKVYELVSGANITVQTNGIYNLTLTCTVTSGDHTSFTWWRNGEALVNDSTRHIRVLGNTLEVSHTAEVEDAVYKCEARNPISNETAEIKLRDICKLDTCELVSGANITVQTTGICNLTLTCTVTSGDPTSFTWWRNGEALVNDSTRHIRVLGNTLEVSHTAEVEDAVYKCEARNPISNETAEIKLRDICKLDTCELVSGANITVQTTGICNLTLTCTMTSGDPTSFTWWRNGEALVNESTQHIRVLGNTLEVSHTAEVKDAVYKCEARNPISNEMAEIKLRNICKLDTCSAGLVSGANITVENITGCCNLTLICTVTSGDPTSFTWWRNGEVLVNDSMQHILVLGNTLEVHHTAEDAVYKCEARNPISNATAEIRLRNICKLDTCGDNFLKSISALSASINIVGVIVGLIFSLYFTLRRSATGERGSAGKPTSQQLNLRRISGNKEFGSNRQPLKGNEMVRGDVLPQ
ncbi:HEPACAM family member 2-like isoform X1 [Hypanus sabinus]|uniref:HEPACAM family member 2-like isoform X1 n=1 Tax=Hypanus sabinus TaxID=79690 RepID=UPI0028C49F79|nr:HEPACAM family member 2-like isoform X1 [Hypanus sabinus]